MDLQMPKLKHLQQFTDVEYTMIVVQSPDVTADAF